jgi:hypothetical protein
MNGALLCLALMVYGLAWLAFYGADHRARPDKKHAWERVGAALAALATFGALLSLGGMLGQVWAAAGEGVGLFVLVIVTIAAGAFGYFAIIRGFKHHRHSTLALGIVLGGAVALAYGDWRVIRANTGKYLASAGQGITSAAGGTAGTTAAHGHTAHGHAASGGGAWGIILILIAAVVLGAIIVRKHRKGEVTNVGRAALTAGGSRRAGGRNPAGSGSRNAAAALFAGDDS